MPKSNITKKSFVLSVIALILCFALLIGATYAWFTDSVTSGRNTMLAGVLDVELEYKDENGNWQAVKADTDLFDIAGNGEKGLWEPGHTEVVYLRVRNAGSLAFEYKVQANLFGDEDCTKPEAVYTNVENGKFKLSEYLVMSKTKGAEKVVKRDAVWMTDLNEEKAALGKLDTASYGSESKLYPEEKSDAAHPYFEEFTLAVYMPTWVGNEANQLTSAIEDEGQPTLYLGLDLVAKQTPFENDSFGNDYDMNAKYPDPGVMTGTDTKEPEADGSAKFIFEGVAPAGDEYTTTVEFAENSFEEGNKVELKIEVGTVPENGTVEGVPEYEGYTAKAYVDLSLVINGEQIDGFNCPGIKITTVVQKNLKKTPVVKYVDDSGELDDSAYPSTYTALNGQLVFTTTHLSRYAVYTENDRVFDEQYTLMTGSALSALIKNKANASEKFTRDSYDYKVRSVSFREYEESLGEWENGTVVDAENKGDIRLFMDSDNNVYICVKPNNQIMLNAESDYLFCKIAGMTSVDFGGIVSTENVTNMHNMFLDDWALVTISGIDYWDTANVTNMWNVFFGCGKLQSIERLISTWDVSKVENMSALFGGCDELTSIDLSAWNTAALKDASRMFAGDEKLEEAHMFTNTSSLTDTSDMFLSCFALKTIEGLNQWDTSKITTTESMFCMSAQGSGNPYNSASLERLDLSGWDLSSNTNISSMFSGNIKLKELNVNWSNTSKITNMRSVFMQCQSLQSIDLSSWDTSAATTMYQMFDNCRSLTDLRLSVKWNTSNVTTMEYMFSGCNSLERLDLSGWDTGKVTTMSCMFQHCYALREVNVKGLNVENVTNMSNMFLMCYALEHFDASGWNTRSVTNMTSMLENCTSLIDADVSYWDITNLYYTKQMFNGCSNLTTIWSDKSWEKTFSGADMFRLCNSLVGRSNGGLTFHASRRTASYAKIDGGYFTDVAQKTA